MKKAKPSDILILQEGETVLRKVKGDCYQTPLLAITKQVSGTISFTDRRILFRGIGIVEAARLCFAIPYEDITALELCRVFVFPFGIRIRTTDGTYRISVRKRKEIMELIEEQRRVPHGA